MRKLNFIATLMLVATVGLFFSCKEDDPKPKVFKISPAEIVFTAIGEEHQLTATLDGEAVKATWSAAPDGLVEITEDGKVKLLSQGYGKITAKYETYTATISFSCSLPELYVIPYLRMFDGFEKILVYEASLGHEWLSEQSDPSMGYYLFKTNSELMPMVGYMVGQVAQVYADAEVIMSEEFKAFMAEKGFTTTGEVSYGYYMPFTSPYETVSAWGQTSTIEDYGIVPGMCFKAQNPTMTAISYPNLDWNSTAQQIEAFETGRGYTKNTTRNLADGKTLVVYGHKEEKAEFTEYYINYYFFSAEDKLIKVAFCIIPAQYVLTPMGEAFSLTDSFKTFITTGEGYTERNVEGGANRKVYTKESAGNKFTINMWNLTIGVSEYVAAGLEFVPFDGPDEIDIELN